MKVVKIEKLIDRGAFSKTEDWKRLEAQILDAISSVEWPPGSGSFTLFDQSGKKSGEGSGVKPIKEACMKRLDALGWSLETELPLAARKKPGKMDATHPVGRQLFCVEWETGNISSSHRALNKMALGIIKKALIGGVLIVPTRAMYRYLTDRIGNFEELEPYFPLWGSLKVREGLLEVIAIEHDAVSRSVKRIPKATDGRARR